MRISCLGLLLSFALAGCTGAPRTPDAELAVLQPPPLFASYPGTAPYRARAVSPPFVARLTALEPQQSWGPVTILQAGSPPVRLSEAGVAFENVGSSSAFPAGR